MLIETKYMDDRSLLSIQGSVHYSDTFFINKLVNQKLQIVVKSFNAYFIIRFPEKLGLHHLVTKNVHGTSRTSKLSMQMVMGIGFQQNLVDC